MTTQKQECFTKWFALTAATTTLLLVCILFNTSISNDGINNHTIFTSFIRQNNATETEFSIPSDHSPLIPLQPSDIWGFAFAALGLILASGGGIGGGGMLVPIYILVLGFLPKHAIPLSNVTVFGGAIANTWSNVRKRHPCADR